MKIKLSNVDKYFIIDDSDYDKIKDYTWRLDKTKVTTNIARGKVVQLTRFLLDIPTGKRQYVYFKNNDNLDFRRENLTFTRPPRVKNEFSEDSITINKKNKSYTFYFDNEDLERIKQYNWVVNNQGYCISNTITPKKPVPLHRFILEYDGNDVVDHIDRDITNNRKKNLRIVTKSQNAFNCKLPTDNTSGIRGVVWNYNGYRASVRCNKKQYYSQTFKVEVYGEEKAKFMAKKARDIIRKKLYGEFQIKGE